MKSFYIETYGCSANQSHSEVMAGVLEDNGFSIVKKIENADAIVINTCIVKTPTENKIRDRIRFIRNKYPNKKLVIAGCATDGEYRIFKRLAPEALFLSSHKSRDIAKLLSGKKKRTGRKIRKNPLVGITEIASGCLGRCAYCIVKLARGDLRSRKPREIEDEIKNSLKEGCKEIWITSQDCGCYGLDIKTNLAKLLKEMVKIKGEFRVRVGMMNTTYIKPILKDLVKIYREPKIYRFIHIPFQSGSDKILKSMNRGYHVKDFKKIVKEFRREFPDITLSTDIIVGFPGETERDFQKSLDLVRRIKPDIINVSKFSPRPRTQASRMRQLDNRVVKERSKIMAELVRKTGFERNKKLVKSEFSILVNERGKEKNQFMGRNEYYKPVVITSKKNVMGNFLKVRITSAGKTHLIGEILER